MSIDEELERLGELPATPEEEQLGKFLEEALQRFEAGTPINADACFSSSKELSAEADGLMDTSKLLYDSAAVVWESILLPTDSEPAPNSAERELVPGEFAALKLLGEGKWGRVWLAKDLHLQRDVVLKSLRPAGDSQTRETRLHALRNEATLLAKLRHHPNVVQVYAWRETESEHFIVMQFVAGGSLADRLERDGPLDWQHASRYIADAAEGLQKAHELGIIHRDIKPANILWDPETEEAMLTDFGISTILNEARNVAGSPFYMPPEAWEGDLSPLVDVYSLAVSLFELVTGSVPFPGPSPVQVREQSVSGIPDRDPRFASTPGDLEQVIRAGLSPLPENRVSLDSFVRDLRATLNQLMADTFPLSEDDEFTRDRVRTSLVVSREQPDGSFRRVAATGHTSESLTRDMKKVPPKPNQVVLKTGDRVRVEVEADSDGFILVFNIGPTGNLNQLYPDSLGRDFVGAPLEANRSMHVLNVEMAPPTGTERLVAIWTRDRLQVTHEDIASVADSSCEGISASYLASRDIKRVRRSLQQVPRPDWSVAVVQVEHVT